MSQATTREKKSRYDAVDLSIDETIIYDVENTDAWVQGYGHPIEDMI